ncbi:superfamily II DNA or RNA helicase [Clostridium moniliforme]|uniref:Superfamily II DNA or RNA helicase n=1 Tax=Clostridium moniliforme TaxID=39489 RepID=A0ABS4EXD3_9CLOT|nr:DEAD/DEAH box helicase family protein [Clostridium moniliforme]MBP1888660.1 superfamily II DNA or RNA helicase [Clostridium moniliforme]
MKNKAIEKEISITEIKEKGIEENINCITGGDSNFLIHKLRDSFKREKRVDIIVAFLRETGVKLLNNDLKVALENGCKIRILTGNYLGITEPSALYLMKDILEDKADMRFYKDSKRSFHPKAYIFYYENGKGDIFIGSSNISKSALTSGLEWNYRLKKEQNEEDFNYFCKEFENLFLNESIILNDQELKKYSKSWKKPKIYKTGNIEDNNSCDNNIIPLFSPRGAQIEALVELKRLREDGMDKGIVVASTGIGKTYLAAFDSLEFNRVLFIAHREEILNQAEESFKNVRNNLKTGFFRGESKDKDADALFASVQSLGKEEYLNENWFSKDYFDYIVIDEFHHSVTKNYQNIINYFNPKFLLGITATPERMDNRDVFSICDYNIAYEIRLREAINKGYLCPFRYYGIYDETVDYNNINIKNGKYNVLELEKALMLDRRANLILKHYKKFNSKQALGFCSSKAHAEYMARYFSENGVKSCAVYSDSKGEYSLNREEALNRLKNNEINIIFSVDMFNEGVDIKSLDMVMFLRPTESQTVFMQQLGRGLRLDKNKEYVNVLDFIGNYKKADMIPKLIGGIKPKDRSISNNPNYFEYPEDCYIDFDFELVDLYKKLLSKEMKFEEKLKEEFYRVKEYINKIPNREEFITLMDGEIYGEVRKKGKKSPFRNYLAFLDSIDELNIYEKALKGTIAEEFINYIESTNMSKTYKMPILLAFYNNGNMKLSISEDDIYKSMKEFYSKPSNKQDIIGKNNKDFLEKWEKKDYIKKAKEMPLKFLLNSGSKFFSFEGKDFTITKELEEFLSNDIFKENVIDSINMRVIEYYKNRGINNANEED